MVRKKHNKNKEDKICRNNFKKKGSNLEEDNFKTFLKDKARLEQKKA